MTELEGNSAIDNGFIEKSGSTTIATTSRTLSPEEDRRLLRKIDLW